MKRHGARDRNAARASLAVCRTIVLTGILAVAIVALFLHQLAIERARVRGACLALEMAGAHGALDEVRYRRIVRGMTGGINAYHERLPVSYAEMIRTCAAVRAAP